MLVWPAMSANPLKAPLEALKKTLIDAADSAPTVPESFHEHVKSVEATARNIVRITDELDHTIDLANNISKAVAMLKAVSPIMHFVAENTSKARADMMSQFMSSLSDCKQRRDDLRWAKETTERSVASLALQYFAVDQDYQELLKGYNLLSFDGGFQIALAATVARRNDLYEAVYEAKGALDVLSVQCLAVEAEYQEMMDSLPWVQGAIQLPSTLENATSRLLSAAIPVDIMIHKLVEEHSDEFQRSIVNVHFTPPEDQHGAIDQPVNTTSPMSGARRGAVAMPTGAFLLLFVLGSCLWSA